MKAKVSRFQALTLHLSHAWHCLSVLSALGGAENSWQNHGGSSSEVQLQTDMSSLGTAAMQALTPPRAGSCKTTATWKDGYEITFLLLLWWLSHFTPYLSPFHRHSGWIKWIKNWFDKYEWSCKLMWKKVFTVSFSMNESWTEISSSALEINS